MEVNNCIGCPCLIKGVKYREDIYRCSALNEELRYEDGRDDQGGWIPLVYSFNCPFDKIEDSKTGEMFKPKQILV